MVLFQNEACVVINKLPGESSENIRLEGGAGDLFPVHRLDTPVSGCLLLAKTKAAAAFLGDCFARSAGVEKRYWAIIEKPKEEIPATAELVHLLSENKKLNKSFAVPLKEDPSKEGPLNEDPSKEDPLTEKPCPLKWQGRKAGGPSRPKKAVLRYRVAGAGEHYLFLEIDLVTGRHHQIRAQLAAAGLHVKGDLKYAARRGGGIRLYAYSLAFPNPLNPGETIRVKALPQVMDNLWAAFAGEVGKEE